MSEKFQVFLFLLGIFGLLVSGIINWFWSDYIDRCPCEKCGRKFVLKTTRHVGVYIKTNGRLDLITEASYRCLNLKCKHARKATISGASITSKPRLA